VEHIITHPPFGRSLDRPAAPSRLVGLFAVHHHGDDDARCFARPAAEGSTMAPAACANWLR